MSKIDLGELESEVERIAHAYDIHCSHSRQGAKTYWFAFVPRNHELFDELVGVSSTRRRDVDRIICEVVKRWEQEKATKND